jgi:hypothetical protein
LTELNPDIWQAAVYGLGVLAEHGGAMIDQHAEVLLRLLLIKAEQWRSDPSGSGDAAAAADNAASAAFKFCLSRSHVLSPPLVKGALPVLLSWLPLKTDIDEGKDVLRRIVTQCEQKSMLLSAQECIVPLIDVLLAVMVYQPPEQDDDDLEDKDEQSDSCLTNADADALWSNQFTDKSLRKRVEALLSDFQSKHPAVLATAWQKADEDTRLGVLTSTDTFEQRYTS